MKKTLLFLWVLLVIVAGCQRQARVSLPDNGLFLEGEAAFRSGDHERAAAIYEQILEMGLEPVRERAMYRLALIQGLEERSVDPTGQETYRERLSAEYPGSRLSVEFDTTLAVLAELGRLRREQERQMSEFQRLAVELARIRDERAVLEGRFGGTLTADATPQTDATRSDQATSSPADDPKDPLNADLAQLGEDLVQLTRDYQDTPVSNVALLMLGLLSDIQELRQVRETQLERLDELVAEVEVLREELGKLREADLRRLPN